jgi:DNA-damage-inducible protein D
MISFDEARLYILKKNKDEPAYCHAESFRKALVNTGLHRALGSDALEIRKRMISVEVLPEVARIAGKRYVVPSVSSTAQGRAAYVERVVDAQSRIDIDREIELEFQARCNSKDKAEQDITKAGIDHAIAKFAQPLEGETSPFDRILHVDDKGVECWDARELQAVLGYERWENFAPLVAKTQKALEQSGRLAVDHVRAITKMVGLGSGASREVESYRLSREACYAVAMEGDNSKPQIRAAKEYFRVQTRRMELTDAGASDVERMSGLTNMSEGMAAVVADLVAGAMTEARKDQARHNAETIVILETIADKINDLVKDTVSKLKADEARKRNDFLPWQKTKIARLFYAYTGDGCDLLDGARLVKKDGSLIDGAVEFDHIDNNRNNRNIENGIPLSPSTHARKARWTADEKAMINGFQLYVKMQIRKGSGTQLGLLEEHI